MAKTSKINKQLRRQSLVERYAERRAQYKRDSVNPHLSQEEREQAMAKLHALPRDASPTRLRNRDAIDGRPRGYLRKFGLSRINLREMAHRGELPGVTKSSW
ncbi:30S ribosomal protein S14 [Bifidobacterium sp.]|jgi:small subunit ribosomal protein S14|uniref:30S ribosomal protein S14 n=1 Tax=Bifidobacterium sp. TaxID=41200 RepID=UPI0025BB3D42|nr:30S ribosomal protein S14 [Bifidobacterium sp.]MCH4159925.1 30S ribosomal protein S14 [Bifidobacterium sp.]MCH4175122.1 30S ribosomal protein S14 [Bifidobacterium sp.]MCI1635473.1 30S ribosomal protein S14 [Bifidobacterium sp.]